jgi:hypothetical protein
MNQKETITRRGVQIFIENPFMLKGVKSKIKKVTNNRGDMMLVSSETGEITAPVAGFWEAKEVDSSQFVKLYVNGVKALAELTSAGTKVFTLLYQELQNNIGKDKVYLSYSKLRNLNLDVMSRKTFQRGIAELIEKKFVAACADGESWYWINPDFVFNGDRLAFVREYRKVKFKKMEDNADNAKPTSLFPDFDKVV